MLLRTFHRDVSGIVRGVRGEVGTSKIMDPSQVSSIVTSETGGMPITGLIICLVSDFRAFGEVSTGGTVTLPANVSVGVLQVTVSGRTDSFIPIDGGEPSGISSRVGIFIRGFAR